MRALRLAAVAVLLSITSIHAPLANAQILDSGVGRCLMCGHSELDTQRYVNSFLNQMFFPRTLLGRAFVAGNLYILSATFTMHGSQSPDSDFASVSIAITAEVKNALPTGNYHVTVTTPGGKTSKATYVIGDTRFSVNYAYVSGAVSNGARRTGSSRVGYSGPPTSSGPWQNRGRPRGSAKCSHSRREDRGNETIAWCSRD
jgi:hypothetical protein